MYRRWPSAKIVSNAKDDFPLPESPVKSTIFPRGIDSEIFFKLCVFAPFIVILSSTVVFSYIHKLSPWVVPRGTYGQYNTAYFFLLFFFPSLVKEKSSSRISAAVSKSRFLTASDISFFFAVINLRGFFL